MIFIGMQLEKANNGQVLALQASFDPNPTNALASSAPFRLMESPWKNALDRFYSLS
jgi:hypothetical protein